MIPRARDGRRWGHLPPMVVRYAKFSTDNLTAAAARIEGQVVVCPRTTVGDGRGGTMTVCSVSKYPCGRLSRRQRERTAKALIKSLL